MDNKYCNVSNIPQCLKWHSLIDVLDAIDSVSDFEDEEEYTEDDDDEEDGAEIDNRLIKST